MSDNKLPSIVIYFLSKISGFISAILTFDPKFADYYAWRVMSDEPKIDALYGFEDCALIK